MKSYKPTTPGLRHRIKEDFSMLTPKEPERGLLSALKQKAGRSRDGRMTVRHRGGGSKQLYRIIDFGQQGINLKAKVIALEYDPNRTAFLALLQYDNGERSYIIAPDGLKVNDEVNCSEKAELKPGNRMKLKNIPVGTQVYNIEIQSGGGGKLAKSAGTSARILAQEGKYTHLEMPSKEMRKVLQECFASIGIVSRPDHRYIKLGKAGKSRHRGIRPTVRGGAMNPPDHPHGGGEGKSPIGLPGPKTPWGKPARGVKTRRKRSWTDKYIIQRRKA